MIPDFLCSPDVGDDHVFVIGIHYPGERMVGLPLIFQDDRRRSGP